MLRILNKIKNNIGWVLLGSILGMGLFTGVSTSASTLQGFQGGTGYSATAIGNAGNCFYVSSTSPFLIYDFKPCSSGGSATATISAQGTSASAPFTFATSGPLMSISTNGANTVTFTSIPTSTILAGYIQAAPATTTINSQNGPTFTFNGTASQIQITNSGTTFTIGAAQNIAPTSSPTFSFLTITNNITSTTGYFSTSVSSTGASFTNATTSNNLYVYGFTSSSQAYENSSTVGTSLTLSYIAANSFLALDANKKVIATSTPSGGAGTPAGNNGDVQINNQAAFGVDSGGFFNYSTSTHRLVLGHQTSSLFIGNNADFATSSSAGPPVASSTSFSFSNGTSSFTIPTGVTSITVTVVGGKGGTGNQGIASSTGGVSTGTLAVSAGQVYYFAVGANGNNAGTSAYPGGGLGYVSANQSGGGGGMTWFGTSGANATGTAWQSSVLLVAGGGGGGGATGPSGVGGGTSGGNGSSNAPCGTPTGGSQSSAGNGGTGGTANGANGAAGQGGNGGFGGSTENGAGGGAGYFGGGGGGSQNGACWPSGGGGSGFASSTMTATSTTSNLTNATTSISFSYQIPGATIITVFSTSSAALYVGGHIYTGNQNLATSSVSSCGSSPGILGNDTAGTVQIGSGIVTSCKVTFGTSYLNSPICTLGTYSTAVTAGISSETTSSLTVGFSATLGGGQFNYICLDL